MKKGQDLFADLLYKLSLKIRCFIFLQHFFLLQDYNDIQQKKLPYRKYELSFQGSANLVRILRNYRKASH